MVTYSLTPRTKKKVLEAELQAAQRAGILRTELLDRVLIDSFDTGPCIRFPDQAQFQPLQYISCVAGAVIRNGGLVYTRTRARDVTSGGVTTEDGYKIKGRQVVVATNAPIVDKISKMAFIGRNPRNKRKNIFIATGDSGNGITHGTISGVLLTDLILGRKNKWTRLYNPSRKIKTRSQVGNAQDSDSSEDSGKLDMTAALNKARALRVEQGLVLEIKRKDPLAFYKDQSGRRPRYQRAKLARFHRNYKRTKIIEKLAILCNDDAKKLRWQIRQGHLLLIPNCLCLV